MKIFKGKVISTKMAKTATVAVERVVVHALYKKRFKRIKKYHVHDEIGVAVGQTVTFVACKPISKLKRWKIVEVVGQSKLKTKKETKEVKEVKTKKGAKTKAK
jgi:small subunit ribosomal protein S17